MNNIKKLCLYCLDCIKSTSKNSDFVNLKKNKDNKIIITDKEEFDANNKEIVKIITKQALNKSTMGIYTGFLMLENKKYYSPLLYCEAELIRENDKIKLIYDTDAITINVSLIAALLDNDSDIIENAINQLLEIENPEQIDFKKILSGLINIDDIEIKEEKSIILAKMPESIAGLVNELKQIAELY